MSDRLFFSLAGVLALTILALALVWPQGLGAPSPGPFRRPLGPVDPEAAAAARAAALKAEKVRITRPRPPPPPSAKAKPPAAPASPAAAPTLRPGPSPSDISPGGRP